MAQRLTFIVFGVPRSGTKALARALNLHPQILCASERFDYRVDHSELAFPDDFLGGRRLMDRLDRRKLQTLRALASEKPDVRFVGNKLPRYYLALDRLNSELPELRNIAIYRSPYDFIPSWNRKEAAHGSSRWLAGDIGLYGFLDLLVCLQNLVRQPRAFLFPYDYGLNESVEPILAAVDFVGADRTVFDQGTFLERTLPKRRTNPRRIPLAAHEVEFLDRLRVRDLDEIVASGWGNVAAPLASQIDDYLASIAGDLPAAVDAAFTASDNQAASLYGARYLASHRAELAGLLELVQGSEYMASLERFGPVQEMRFLLSQRRLVSRRARSVRLTDED